MSECEWCNRGLPIGENGEHYRPQELGRGETLLCSTRACDELSRAMKVVEAYNELIYAVETKFPDETRHQTALRYIMERERHCNGPERADTQPGGQNERHETL